MTVESESDGVDDVASAGVARDDELGPRMAQLAMRVEALAGLVESLFDRVERSVSASAPLTAEELADIAARMVRLIENRLEAHSERLEVLISALAETAPRASVPAAGTADLSVIDDHMTIIGRALIDMKQAVQRLERAPDEVHEMAILAHFDRWFEETNSRQATDVEHTRRDLHRFDIALTEMHAHLAEFPDRDAVHELSQVLAQVTRDSDVVALRRAIDDLPKLIYVEPPAATVDSPIVEQVTARLIETSEALAEKINEQLTAKVQRFEALSQAMMTLVGDPVDSLAQKLNEVIHRLDALDAAKPDTDRT